MDLPEERSRDLGALRGLLLSAERFKSEPFAVELFRKINQLRDQIKTEWYQSKNLSAAEHESFKKADYILTAILRIPDTLRLEYSQQLLAQEKKNQWDRWGSRPQPMSGGPKHDEGIENVTAQGLEGNSEVTREWRT